jgi:hypothetical protein
MFLIIFTMLSTLFFLFENAYATTDTGPEWWEWPLVLWPLEMMIIAIIGTVIVIKKRITKPQTTKTKRIVLFGSILVVLDILLLLILLFQDRFGM